MVCKSCRVDFIQNQTLRAREGDFEVFCFDDGEFMRLVSPSPGASLSNLTTILAEMWKV